MAPDDVARDYDLPVEAVREAIHYCVRMPLLQREREEDWADSHSRGRVAATPAIASDVDVEP